MKRTSTTTTSPQRQEDQPEHNRGRAGGHCPDPMQPKYPITRARQDPGPDTAAGWLLIPADTARGPGQPAGLPLAAHARTRRDLPAAIGVRAARRRRRAQGHRPELALSLESACRAGRTAEEFQAQGVQVGQEIADVLRQEARVLQRIMDLSIARPRRALPEDREREGRVRD